MKSDMILDNIPCGIVKLKAESGFPVLYANDEFKQLHGAAKRLEDIWVMRPHVLSLSFEVQQREETSAGTSSASITSPEAGKKCCTAS